MPLFVMIGRDGTDGAARRDENRDAHIRHLESLTEAGKIRYAGPIRDASNAQSVGAVIVYEATSLEHARELVEQDPYVAGGVFETWTLDPFRQAIPEP